MGIKLKFDEEEKKKKKKNAGDLLNDDRFSALFSDERFEVDKEDEAFKLIQPVVSKLDKDKRQEFEAKYAVRSDEEDDRADGDSDIDLDDSEAESSDDDVEWTKNLKREHKNIKQEKSIERRNQNFLRKEQNLLKMTEKSQKVSKHKLTEVDGDDFVSLAEKKTKQKKSKLSLERRLEAQSEEGEVVRLETGHVMTFAPEKSKQRERREEEEKRHRDERREVRRSAKSLKKDKLPPRFWMGKRVR